MRVGDYVRTKDGKIVKCFKSESMNKPIYYVIGSATNGYIEYQDVIKSSPNIIDLIEVGDYVNGVLVEEIYQREEDKLYIHTFDTEIMLCYTNSNIETIVTKEQFESMEYKIGE